MILESTGQTKVYRDLADYEARFDGHMAPETIMPGSVVSDVYWIQRWPAENS